MSNKENSATLGFNSQQQKAIDHVEGPLLVVAGAGTGQDARHHRTHPPPARIATPELAGENILGLTFTDKAAGEMKQRVMKASRRSRRRRLAQHVPLILPRKNPASGESRNPAARRPSTTGSSFAATSSSSTLKQFRRLQEPGEFLSDFVRFLLALPGRTRHAGRLPAVRGRNCAASTTRARSALEPDARQAAEEELARQEELARVYRVSERLLRERNLLTFGAQLAECRRAAARRCELLLERMREQYRYILVDEFQDTNIAQLELLWLLAGERWQHRGRRRPRPGDLPLPRRVLRKLHHVSEALLRRHRPKVRPESRRISRVALAELPLDQRILRTCRRE